MKNSIKGSVRDGYTVNGKKVSNTEAFKRAELDPDYEVYKLHYKNRNPIKVIRSVPDNSLSDNVNVRTNAKLKRKK